MTDATKPCPREPADEMVSACEEYLPGRFSAMQWRSILRRAWDAAPAPAPEPPQDYAAMSDALWAKGCAARYLRERVVEAARDALAAAMPSEGADAALAYAAEHTRAEAGEARAEANAKDAEGLRTWLDNNTTFYDIAPGEECVPVLSSVSKRIWYHASDNLTDYPFSAAIDAARGAGKGGEHGPD